MNRSFKEISWDVNEDIYRADSALSYSTIARYERDGFNGLVKLYDKVETPSLTFGSAVDSIITGGMEEFNSRFMVADFPSIKDSVLPVVKELFRCYRSTYTSLQDIPYDAVLSTALQFNYQNNWKPETRVKVIKEEGDAYYKLMYIADGRTILSTETYRDVTNSVRALKESDATRWYFQEDIPFENIERLYQLKFKAILDNIEYRCMADLIIVDHDNKTIIPVDLKTSSKYEWDFYKSFIEWNYQMQARLYWRIIRKNMDNDPYFKDFILEDYRFIVANKRSLTPLVWVCPFTKAYGRLLKGRSENIVLNDPEEVGKELHYYLENRPAIPKGITDTNNLEEWINTL